MAKSITPNQIKQTNRNIIYRFIYDNKGAGISQQDIAIALRLSRPTVTSNLASLERAGLIKKDGRIDSELVGRKAASYSIEPQFMLAVGVQILKNELRIAMIDLYGDIVEKRSVPIEFSMDSSYFEAVGREILDFQHSTGVETEKILGVGFALEGLVSKDRRSVIYGRILSCTGLSNEDFSEYLPYDCELVHDADSAAVSELWVSPEINGAVYLSLSRHLGAAVISDGNIIAGKHGHNATVEHMRLEHGGKKCYCGNNGCAETLCSLSALLGENAEAECAEAFFDRLRNGEAEECGRWKEYLTNLADVINILHLVQDTDFILGGYLAQYLRAEDLTYIYERIAACTPFEEDSDFIHISKMPEHNITVGAALPFVQRFLNGDLPGGGQAD